MFVHFLHAYGNRPSKLSMETSSSDVRYRIFLKNIFYVKLNQIVAHVFTAFARAWKFLAQQVNLF